MKPIKLKFLSQEDILRSGLSMQETISIVEKVFVEHGNEHYENPPKPGIHPKTDAFVHAMPAYLKRMQIAGMKWVSGFSSNAQHDLPNVMGIIILNDVETGQPLAIMEGGLITAMRTAAVSGVSAKYLAQPSASTVGIVGAGVQGRFHLAALKEVLPEIKKVKIYDIHEPTLAAYVKGFKQIMPFDIIIEKSVENTVKGSDVVVTATGNLSQTLYFERWIKQGALVLPVHMFGWEKTAITNMDKFIVDDWDQFSTYINLHGRQYTPLPDLDAQLGEIVANKKQGRASSSERIINFNLGIAVHDIAVANKIFLKAMDAKIGKTLELMRHLPPFFI